MQRSARKTPRAGILKMPLLDFFDYTFIKSFAWVWLGALYGAHLVAMMGVLVVLGAQQQRRCDSFIVANHVMDAGQNRYVKNFYPEGDPLLSEADRSGCRVIYQRTENGKDIYGIWQVSKRNILYQPWFLSWLLGGLAVILVGHYAYCVAARRREFRLREQWARLR